MSAVSIRARYFEDGTPDRRYTVDHVILTTPDGGLVRGYHVSYLSQDITDEPVSLPEARAIAEDHAKFVAQGA